MKLFNSIGSGSSNQPGRDVAAQCRSRRGASGFSLMEVVISLTIMVVAFHGILKAYAFSNARAEWSSHSLAAQSLALQQVEAMRSAKWDPQAWPAIDEAGVTNFITAEILDVPAGGAPVHATNTVSVTTVSDNPPLRQIRVDCIWEFPLRGMFTNTIITLRAADQ